MNTKLALTIDFGTQSLRVALINKKGDIVAMEKRVYEEPYFSLKKGYAEQHADYYYEKLVDAMKSLTSKNKNILKNIIGATVTTFRDTAVLLDSKNKPLRPCILWLDQRNAKAKEKLPFFHRIAFFIVTCIRAARQCRMRLKANEPWDKMRRNSERTGRLNPDPDAHPPAAPHIPSGAGGRERWRGLHPPRHYKQLSERRRLPDSRATA